MYLMQFLDLYEFDIHYSNSKGEKCSKCSFGSECKGCIVPPDFDIQLKQYVRKFRLQGYFTIETRPHRKFPENPKLGSRIGTDPSYFLTRRLNLFAKVAQNY